MLVKIASAVILGLVAVCMGCTMCCHPYDYCGPVYDGCGQCGSNGRAGSILPGNSRQPLSVATREDGIEVNAPDGEQYSPGVEQSEGATQILSVTDRKVEDPGFIAKSQPMAGQSKPTLAQPTPAKRR